MKASELIAELANLIEQDGDLDVLTPGLDGCGWDHISAIETKPVVRVDSVVCTFEDQQATPATALHVHVFCVW